jgi:hypothetical protein
VGYVWLLCADELLAQNRDLQASITLAQPQRHIPAAPIHRLSRAQTTPAAFEGIPHLRVRSDSACAATGPIGSVRPVQLISASDSASNHGSAYSAAVVGECFEDAAIATALVGACEGGGSLMPDAPRSAAQRSAATGLETRRE